MRNVALSLLSLALAACAVGPDYMRPETATQAQFARVGSYAPSEPVAEFWRGFDDPLLTRLIEDSLRDNRDLRATLARWDQARALLRESRFDQAPTVTASGGHVKTRDSSGTSAGVAAAWELDLFGRVRREVEGNRAGAEAAEADLRALQVSVAAEVARTYFELRGAQEQLRVATRNESNQADTSKLTRARLDAGRGTQLDVDRADAQQGFTASRVPALRAEIAIAAHRLAVLGGRGPSALVAELEADAPLPALPTDVAVGTPSDLLRRRPDVAAAERRIAAATARVGVATADLFPRVSLNGELGGVGASLGDLAKAYAFGPRISWAFLDLGRVRARIAASDAAAAEALARYESTVLGALEESENALVSYAKAREERELLDRSARASGSAARLARLRFEGGAADFLQVLDAERTALEAEDRAADSHRHTAQALVAVYAAVAGGWPERMPEVAARP